LEIEEKFLRWGVAHIFGDMSYKIKGFLNEKRDRSKDWPRE